MIRKQTYHTSLHLKGRDVVRMPVYKDGSNCKNTIIVPYERFRWYTGLYLKKDVIYLLYISAEILE